jgi:hypothetical protein
MIYPFPVLPTADLSQPPGTFTTRPLNTIHREVNRSEHAYSILTWPCIVGRLDVESWLSIRLKYKTLQASTLDYYMIDLLSLLVGSVWLWIVIPHSTRYDPLRLECIVFLISISSITIRAV